MPKFKVSRGSMLVDWSTALSLATTAAMITVPGLRTFVHESQRSAVVNELQHEIRQAAAQANQLGETITLCASDAAGERCADEGNWSRGWLAFVDLNGDGLMQDDEVKLRLWRTPNTETNIAVTAAPAAFSFRPYYKRPFEATAPGSLTVCDREGHGGRRAIQINSAGVARLGAVQSSKRGCHAQT